jgi:uncharacterized membrane protein YgcG
VQVLEAAALVLLRRLLVVVAVAEVVIAVVVMILVACFCPCLEVAKEERGQEVVVLPAKSRQSSGCSARHGIAGDCKCASECVSCNYVL